MPFRSHHTSDKSRQDAELRALGLPAAKSGRWGEVGAVTLVVAGLGMWAGFKLGFGPTLFKITTISSAVLGVALGLKLRNWVLQNNAKRLSDLKRDNAAIQEAETQRKLAYMRKNKGQE